jgi:hypothetical protein
MLDLLSGLLPTGVRGLHAGQKKLKTSKMQAELQGGLGAVQQTAEACDRSDETPMVRLLGMDSQALGALFSRY